MYCRSGGKHGGSKCATVATRTDLLIFSQRSGHLGSSTRGNNLLWHRCTHLVFSHTRRTGCMFSHVSYHPSLPLPNTHLSDNNGLKIRGPRSDRKATLFQPGMVCHLACTVVPGPDSWDDAAHRGGVQKWFRAEDITAWRCVSRNKIFHRGT